VIKSYFSPHYCQYFRI